MLIRKRMERTEEITVRPEIESVILIDRAVDLITPLCSQVSTLLGSAGGPVHAIISLTC